jgi:hypothetical protein
MSDDKPQKYAPAPHQLAWQWEERVRNENKQQEAIMTASEGKGRSSGGGGGSQQGGGGRGADIKNHIRQLKELRDAERRLRKEKEAELRNLQTQMQ